LSSQKGRIIIAILSYLWKFEEESVAELSKFYSRYLLEVKIEVAKKTVASLTSVAQGTLLSFLFFSH